MCKRRMIAMVLMLLTFICISFTTVLGAEIQIENAVLEEDTMTVTGRIIGGNNSEVTILIREGEEIVHINQTTAEADGSYRFEFGMPDNAA